LAEVDLHLHTTFSDGTLTPTQLIRLCASKGLKVIAISDHDSTEGLNEANQAMLEFPEMELIYAVELSTDVPRAEIHLLGYYVNMEDRSFQTILSQFRSGRLDRGKEMVERLNEIGLNITWEQVETIADGASIGRPHIAAALVESGYVEYPKDAFDKYIGRNGIAYVERVRVTPVEAVEILVKNGAMPVMAHPTYYSDRSQANDFSDLKSALFELKEAGLVGMEVHYKDYSPSLIMELQNIAGELELIPCGGTDYHASGNPDEPLPGFVGPPMETITRLSTLKSKISDS
jgi:hypothetical protein